MNRTLCFAFTLLTVPGLALAQQDATKPVIASPPPATPAAPPPAQSAPAAGSGTLPQVSPSYVIGPEDSLTVNVWKEPSVSGSFNVRPDGMISMPLLGDLNASGLTPTALGVDITEKLKKYINDPLVTITVLTVNSKHIYLQGNIARPGVQPLTPGVTPMQAIIAAGGVTEYGNAKKIYILRTTADGKTDKIPFNYKKAIKDGNQQGVTLQPNDTIVVP